MSKPQNRIHASLSTSFRGEIHSASHTIDLDRLMLRNEDFSLLHAQLAQSMGIDTYSHLYDVMCSESIVFSDATGLANTYLEAGHFDFEVFAQAWQDDQVLCIVQDIAKACMAIEDLSQHPELQQALIKAYQKGRDVPQVVVGHNMDRF